MTLFSHEIIGMFVYVRTIEGIYLSTLFLQVQEQGTSETAHQESA